VRKILYAIRGEVPSGAVRVLVATRPVDFRKGMDGLAALVRESLGSDPYSGVIYVFRAKRADRMKLLLWDGTGLVLVAKRLEKSSFRWPRRLSSSYGETGAIMGVLPVNTAVETLPVPWIRFFSV
jgi:transposase